MSTKITEITKDLLDLMGFSGAEIQEKESGGRVKVEIKLPDARELIGERGEVLPMFQHIVRRVVARHVDPSPLLDIDINNYKKMREDVLWDFAKGIGAKVQREKKAVELEPMSSFDRRAVHLALAEFSDITTESVGERDRRYIVVRPHP